VDALDFAEIVSLVRDILLIVLLLLATLTLLIVLWKASSLLSSVRRTLKNVEDVAEAVSSRIVGPAAAGSGVAFGAGKVAAFFLGLSKKKRNSKGREDNGKR
jgi:hypothetical protein